MVNRIGSRGEPYW